MMSRIRGLLALLGMIAIVVGMPMLLIAVQHIGAPRFGWNWPGLAQALSSPDDRHHTNGRQQAADSVELAGPTDERRQLRREVVR